MRFAGLLLALLLSLPGFAQDSLDADQQARYRQMIHELRCLVCQNQTIADSDAPLAQDLRQQVEKQIREGRSDAEIKQYLTARYGDFVLYKPPVKGSTLLLWIGPFLLLAVALVMALRMLRRRGSSAAPTPSVDPQALQRLLDEDKK
ncbi:MAG TPA: cytochrome c-type biogenesis protein [Solimonas sp.]|nr:cytochrome c-type biogenesis protein [Solimonas sp.]